MHYNDVVMSLLASQITSLTIVYSPVCSGTDLRKHQSSASLAFVRGIHRGPVNSPHKWPVTRKIFSFDDVIMEYTKNEYNHNKTNNNNTVCICHGIHVDGLVQEKRNSRALATELRLSCINTSMYGVPRMHCSVIYLESYMYVWSHMQPS